VTLPDLKQSGVSFIAFWNQLDNGAGAIDPPTASDAFDTVSEYSNGIQGEIAVNYGGWKTANVRARVKDDGWIVAWFPDYDIPDVRKGGGVAPNDALLLGNLKSDNFSSAGENTLERVVNTIRSSLSSSGSATYNPTDVGLYNFNAGGGTNYTTVYQSERDSGITSTLEPSSSTTIYLSAAVGAAGSTLPDDVVRVNDSPVAREGESFTFNLLANNAISPGGVTEIDVVASFGARSVAKAGTIWG
jgi:hypothetical protein